MWQGTGATSAGKTGEGRWPGSKWVGRREKSLGKGIIWLCWQEGAGSQRGDGRKMAFPGHGVNPVGLVRPRSRETCWMAKQGLRGIDHLFGMGWAGRGGFIPLGGLGFLHLKNSSLLFGK